MGERRRLRREKERQVTFKGYCLLWHHEDPIAHRGTGDVYVNTNDGILRVSINGEWVKCPNGKKEAKRKIEKFLGIKRKK